jgi:LCP family protein required for cell wall assembly
MTSRLARSDPPPARQTPRPLVAAILSALIPGAGQWYAGHRRRAWGYLAVTALVAVPASILLLLIFFVGGVGLALDLSRPFFRNPDLLLVLLVVNIVLLMFRAAAVVDAYVLAREQTPRHTGTTGGVVMAAALAAILVFTTVPHAWAGQRNLALHDLLTYDFVTDPDQAATTSTTPPTTVPGASTTSTTLPPETTTTTQPGPFAGQDRVNILLLGSDAGLGRRGDRTDTMIVVSVDPQTGDTAMFGIPRNIIHIPIPPEHPAASQWPGGLFGGPDYLVWAVYAWGRDNPDLFDAPNAGGEASKVILGNLLGLEVDYFAFVNLQGFVDIIDALGGVDITVTRSMRDDRYPHPDGTYVTLVFDPGTYHMDGREALAFARTRRGSDDYDRMARQRCVLEAMARTADPVSLLRAFPSLVPAIQQSVLTDIPMAMIPDFIELVGKVDTSRMASLRIMPNAPDLAGTGLSYISHTIEGYGVPNVELIRERVDIAINQPPEISLPLLGVDPLSDVCGVGE